MKVCPLTRISSLAPEICPNVLLTGYIFYTERILLYCHGPTKDGHPSRQHPSSIFVVYDWSGV